MNNITWGDGMRRLKIFAVTFTISGLMLGVGQSSAQTYTYDEYGRLKIVTYSSNVKTGYAYDKSDNRTNVQTTTNGILNIPPACQNWSFALSGYPSSYTQATATIIAANFVAHCSDAEGEAMTGTTVNVTVKRGGTEYIPYNVTDQSGGVGSAILTVTFP